MKRRGFIRRLIHGSVATAVAPALPAATVFEDLPKPPIEGVEKATGGGRLLTPEMIAKEALRQLHKNLSMSSTLHRDYAANFRPASGDKLTITMPKKYLTEES